MEQFLRRLKAVSAGVLKEIHSLVRDGTDRKRVKTNKHKMCKEILYRIIQYDRKIPKN